jgi:hypothetical protein
MKYTRVSRPALAPGSDLDVYGRAAMRYYRDGWPDVLPIWRGTAKDKQPMVKGYHGRDGAWPDEKTHQLWSNRYVRSNLALRLPRWVVGLDVDHYDGKAGGSTLADLEDELGLLPAGPISTSRSDGVSGIRLFMLAGDYAGADIAWPAQAGDGIDMITWYERYVIAAPSVHAGGREYAWWQGDSSFRVSRKRPTPSVLPALPEAWCEYLIGLGNTGSAEKWTGREYDGTAVDWLEDYGRGEPCEFMFEMGPRWVRQVMNASSAHDAAVIAVAHAIKSVADDGHTGVNVVLADVRAAFIERVGARGPNERRRGQVKAVGEWRSLLGRAIERFGGDVAEEDEVCDGLEGI